MTKLKPPVLISEYFNDKKNKQAFVYKNYSMYIVEMNKDWKNQYVSEYEILDDAEDCAEEWVNE